MLNVCKIWKSEMRTTTILASKLISLDIIWYQVATFINCLSQTACFIQLFVFTRSKCGLQILLAYKRLKRKTKKENCRNFEAFFLQKQALNTIVFTCFLKMIVLIPHYRCMICFCFLYLFLFAFVSVLQVISEWEFRMIPFLNCSFHHWSYFITAELVVWILLLI